MYRRPSTNPWLRLLDLRCKPNQQVFVTERRDELDADGQALIRPMKRQRDRGLSCNVERDREWRQRTRPLKSHEWLLRMGHELTDRGWRFRNGGSGSRSNPPAHHAATFRV